MVPPRTYYWMLHLVVSDLGGNQVFGVGLKGYGPFLRHYASRGLLIGMVVQRDDAPIGES